MGKIRLDQLVVERGLAESRELARKYILAGWIRVNSQPASKPGNTYAPDVEVERIGEQRFVSRGGEKLEGAFEAFGFSVEGLNCLDVGASTGGFTDCLLQHGARHVVAVDVGHGQIHPRLLGDARVTSREGYNARYMVVEDLPWRPEFAVTDVSFISLTLILRPMAEVLADGGGIMALIKPQFEAGREQVERGGVVRSEAVRQEVVEKVRRFGEEELGLRCVGVVPSPLRGPAGNIEFLSYWRKPSCGMGEDRVS